jgi:hypothetical protein
MSHLLHVYKFKLIKVFHFFPIFFLDLDSIYIYLLKYKLSKRLAVPLLRKKRYDFDDFVTKMSHCDYTSIRV